MNEASRSGSWDALALHLAEGVVLAGRFRLEAPIGAGGMAEVWRARDLHSQRHIALKLLKADVQSSAEAVQRLRREGEVLSALSHPAIVRVETYGQLDGGVVFVAMELLEGETLGARMRRGPIDPAELAPILAGMCAGLFAAHERGIVHRDLKPDNVFLVSSEEPPVVKLLDFGISKVFGETRLTYTGEILGTPRYMSPEQLRAESNIDARVDVYALGVIVYEALVGRPPFLAPTPTDLIVAILHGKVAPLSAVRPELGRELDAVVTRAMARVPQARYASASEFLSAFVGAAGLVPKSAKAGVLPPQSGAVRTQAFGGVDQAATESRSNERSSRPDEDLRPGTFSALAMDEPAGGQGAPSGTLHFGGVQHRESEPSGRISEAKSKPIARTLVEHEWRTFEPRAAPAARADSSASASWDREGLVEPRRNSRRARIWLAVAGLTAGALSAGAVVLALEYWRGDAGTAAVVETADVPSETPVGASDSAPRVEEAVEEASEVQDASFEPPPELVTEARAVRGSPEAPVRERRRPEERPTSSEQARPEPARPIPPIEAASVALSNGDPAACIAILDEFIAHGGTPFALKRRADCAMRAGDREDAIRDYQRFCELVPDHPAVGTVREQLAGMGMTCP